MSFSDILKPRKEVLSGDGVEGIVDLENLRDAKGKHLEAKPQDFLDLTYPTADIRIVLENLHQRFTSPAQSAGLYLFEGYKGSGKSHLLLLVCHLAQHPKLAKAWLARHGIECNLPENIEVIPHKFIDFPLYALWDLIMKGPAKGTFQGRPNLDQVREAIQGRRIFLVLDELEMGIRSIPDKAIQDQNIGFLQMLTEEAERSEARNITIFAGIYDSAREPGSTLKRVRRIDVKFANVADRTRIVLHRLFENSDSIDSKKVEGVLASYRNDWKRKGLSVDDTYMAKLQAGYPFSPELLQLIQEQARNMFQGTRGALGLLGTMVKSAHKKADLITTAHASILDRGILNRLIDLDPGMDLVKCAQSDLSDLGKNRFSDEIVSSILLATLAAAGKIRGMTEDQLALQVVKPGDDINEFRGALNSFHKYGTYFHEQEGVFYFDREEKPSAKVEYKSLSVDSQKAVDKAFEFWAGELFNDREAVVFKYMDQAQAELRQRDSRRLRYVLAPRRLSTEERHDLYFGQANRNMIVLLEPRNKDFDALKNGDILKWAQRYIAASDLQTSAGPVERKKQFERISKEDKSYILEAFRKAGLAFISIQKYGTKAEEDQVEIEQLGNACTRAEVESKLSQNLFPTPLFEEHIQERLEEFTGKRLRDIERTYRETLGYPIPTHVTSLRSALINLCIRKVIGLRHEKDSACGHRLNLAESEWPDAVVSEPFEDEYKPTGLGFADEKQPRTEARPENRPAEGQAGGTEVMPSQRESLVPVETPFVHGMGTLRQEVAVKMSDYPDGIVKEVTFRIFYEKKNEDLGSLPTGLRGSMTGLGNITVDLTITRTGNLGKSDVERVVESLPQFPGGEYKAELKILCPAEGE